MKKFQKIALLLLLIFAEKMVAQDFVEPQFQVREEKNISYGTVPDFGGRPQNLFLDLFKPLGDGNPLRPIFVFIHGGAWLESSHKDAPEIREICQKMAARGYVVASIEYRRGYHRLKNYTPYALCDGAWGTMDECTFALDTAEIRRAWFRAVQDAKGAIRFLKNRHLLDSTDVENVFVGGASAGAFNAIGAGFLDCESEKMVDFGALPDAPIAHAALSDCHFLGAIDPSRPDLGSVEGALHLDAGFDASVRGVANFFGGVFADILAGPEPPRSRPAIWNFHQTSDVIVDCHCAPLLDPFLQQAIYPLNLCQPLTTLPTACGTCSMCDFFAQLPDSQLVYECQIFNVGQPSVLANPAGHSIDNVDLRLDQLAKFFSKIIVGQVELPIGSHCLVAADNLKIADFQVKISPNPGDGEFQIELKNWGGKPTFWQIFDATGRLVATGEAIGEAFSATISDAPPGIFWIKVFGQDFSRVKKLLKN